MRTKPTMRKRMLRSVLVAAFSAVVAFGALSGLSGAKSDARETGGVQSVVVADDELVAVPADSKWD
ncbi:hypothetical protein ACIQJT_17775 [Streptomyces sp. NPDC091972]|uniref:hypothetical protein n=1 Tax=unclassified Streptomyces TaxID=2593676 RepID=UPI00117EEA91|nr:hypothetical protein [Streptomyces sp. NRRL B-24085]